MTELVGASDALEAIRVLWRAHECLSCLRTGGCTHTFVEHGFEFDTGVHYLGRDFMRPKESLYKVWQMLTNGKVPMHQLDDDYDIVCIGSDAPFGFCSGACATIARCFRCDIS